MKEMHRMKQLKKAKELIYSASLEEKEELFEETISQLKEYEERFKKPDNRFNSYEDVSFFAMDHLRVFVRRMIGYNVGWIPDKFEEHCSNNAGRKIKYDRDTRETNSVFIYLISQRGASETQAMKLLMRLRGDRVMTSGHLKELRDSYKDFKKIGIGCNPEKIIFNFSSVISDFLSFTICNLESEEKASKNAVIAFISLWQEIINLMKEYHPIIAKHDKNYPKIFGSAIDWVNEEYDNPLDYFYTHETHKNVSLYKRKQFLREYLNTISFFMDKKIAV